jgi:Spy/CpxP family protein refolding chaperone
MRSESWLRLMSALVLVGVFAAGTLFGAGLMKWTAPPSPPLPAPPHGGPILAMQRELALDDAQLTQLREIAGAHQHELDGIARSTQQQVRTVLFAIEDELAKHLTPEQQKRLVDWRARRGPPPGPGMGPPGMGPPPGGPLPRP